MKWVWTWVILTIALVFIGTAIRSLNFKDNVSVGIFTVIIIIISAVGSLWLLLYVWEVNEISKINF